MNTQSLENSPKYQKIANYATFIVIITILSWFNILLFFLLESASTRGILSWANGVLTLILLLDVLLRWRWAKSARGYFVDRYGWLDLIGSFPVFSLARLPNVIRTIRALHKMGSRHFVRSFISNRGESAVLTITLAVILLFEFASIFILWAEGLAPDANIVTANDAMWWVLVTVATVGYGDKYPVTGNGRFIAMFVIIAGVGLFGILSGYMAQLFLGQREAADGVGDTAVNLDDIMAEIKQLRQEQADVSSRLETLEQHVMGSKKRE